MLGGGYSARLNEEVRVKRGLSYGAGSSLTPHRTLGAFNLVTLGIGCIIGAGIFVLTGHAAATMAGPSVIYAFIISGLACAFAGLCYAELASMIPADATTSKPSSPV